MLVVLIFHTYVFTDCPLISCPNTSGPLLKQQPCSTQACLLIFVMPNCFSCNTDCSASFTFSCTSQLFIPLSLCCLPACPNALNQRITYNCDLPFPLPVSVSLCYFLTRRLKKPNSFSCTYTFTHVHNIQTPSNNHTHLYKNTKVRLFISHFHPHWFWGVLHCSACTEIAYSHFNSHLLERKKQSSPPTQQQQIWKHDNIIKIS